MNIKGNKAIFLASYIFRLSASTELKSDSDFNISGRIVDLQLLKTRSGYNIKKIPLVYTAKKGFSNVLTNFWHIKENKMLKACGNKGSAFVNLPNKPFSMGNFYKTYINNEDVRDAMEELKDKSYTQILNDKAGEFVELKLNTDEKELDDDFEG